MQPGFTNSVLIDNGTSAVIFDPWGGAADWNTLLHDRGLNLNAVYVTHGHYDHISAIPKLCNPGKWYMNNDDIPIIKWSNPILFTQGYGTIDVKKNPPAPLVPGIIEILPGLSVEVISTPGHSKGSICFYLPSEKTLITGDTLFYNSIGRMDLPGGSESAMRESMRLLRRREFPGDTTIIPGHGPTGKLAKIIKENKLLQSW